MRTVPRFGKLAKPQAIDFTGTFNPIKDGEILAPDYNQMKVEQNARSTSERELECK